MSSSVSLVDSFSPVINVISQFHDLVIVVVVFILSVVLYSLCLAMKKNAFSFTQESEVLEIVWTAFPFLVLCGVAAPSLLVLYLSDELCEPSLTLNIVGHQWYWSYEYGDFNNEPFDSYMLSTADLQEGFRLLETDLRVVIPVNLEVRLLVTSSDVIHSWTVPSLGVKIDAIPGRLNQLGVNVENSGILFGQCSEICGTNHSFMPICVEMIPLEKFLSIW